MTTHIFEGIRVVVLLCCIIIVSCNKGLSVCELTKEAQGLVENGDYKSAQVKLLEAENLLTDDTRIEDKERLARIKGVVLFSQNMKAEAMEPANRALGYAREMNDTALMEINLINLAMCGDKVDNIVPYLEEAVNLATLQGDKKLAADALDKLAAVFIQTENFSGAQKCLDDAVSFSENNEIARSSINLRQYDLWFHEGKSEEALHGYRSINIDSLNTYGKLMRASAICEILQRKENYREALAYKDTIAMCSDSIRQMDGRKQVEDIEKEYHAAIEHKNQQFHLLLWLSVGAVAVVLTILFMVLKTLSLKKRQVELNDKISSLNTQISNLLHQNNESETENKTEELNLGSVDNLLKQKLNLTLELFRSLPQYAQLKKLNLLHDYTTENKVEIKEAFDTIVGRFSDCCSDLRQAVTGMTNDDCIYCIMNLLGCSKEVVSLSMGSSEEALRRRKSRIKQKLPETLFQFFFSK